MKIKSVLIEGMHNADKKFYTFSGSTYFHGPNGAGKSTVLQAVQLALLGYIPGTNKKPSDIFEHANNHMMSVTVTIDNDGNDVKIRRTWNEKKNSISSDIVIEPESFDISSAIGNIELPIFNFSDFMNVSANKLKEWFISFLPKSAGSFNWESIINTPMDNGLKASEHTLEYANSVCAHLNCDIDGVKTFHDQMKALLSVKNADQKRLVASIQSLVHYDDFDDEIDVESTNRIISNLQDTINKSREYAQIKASNAKINEMIASIECSDCSIDDLVKQKTSINDEFDKKLREVESNISSLESKLHSISAMKKAKYAVIASNGICNYTNEVCASLKAKVDDLKSEIAAADEEISQLTSQIDKEKVIWRELQHERNIKLSKVTSAISNAQRVELLKTQLADLPENFEAVDIDFCYSEMSRLQMMVAMYEANKRYDQLVETLTRDKFAVDNDIEVIKAWIKLTDANGLQNSLMSLPFEELTADMTKYVRKLYRRDDIETKFILSEKPNSFSFGLTINDSYIPFNLLSSGEKCIFTLAMMLCLVSRSNGSLKLVMIDDLLDHLDDAKAEMLFQSISEIDDVQIILAGVKNCVLGDKNINMNVIELQ